MNKKKIKEPIKLREKELRNGNISLYLDSYDNGKRKYEFLHLYLIPEETKIPSVSQTQSRQNESSNFKITSSVSLMLG